MQDKIQIYSDGACANNGKNKGIGGWGAVLLFKGHKKEISGNELNTTNNEMEMKAVVEALKTLKTKQYPVIVYSDSQYIVKGMNQGWYHKWVVNDWTTKEGEPVKNKHLWKALIHYKRYLNLTFIHVKGHDGIKYNEVADDLAVTAKKELIAMQN